MNRPPSLFAGVEPLEVFAALLADLDADPSGSDFYDRICEAICKLTTMQRAAIFMTERREQRVRLGGSYGVRLTELSALKPTLADTPIAQEALRTDAVVVSDRVEEAVPPEYVALLGITTLVCTPMSAAGRGYGVICADRGGGRFEVGDGERHLLWTLGKLAALVATARISTRQQERARGLNYRLRLAREIHERVLQRLFGVSLALGAEPGADDFGLRQRCQSELQEAIVDLRRALERPLAPVPVETDTTLADELERLGSEDGGCRLEVEWAAGVSVPPELEAPAQSFLAEALRNVAKHAEATTVGVEVDGDRDTISLLVRNDGVRGGGRGAGMGLRLAAFEALQQGGTVEFGERDDGQWQARLVLPRARQGDD